MKAPRFFDFTAAAKVLGIDPNSGAEREMRYYINDDALAKLLGTTLIRCWQILLM